MTDRTLMLCMGDMLCMVDMLDTLHTLLHTLALASLLSTLVWWW